MSTYEQNREENRESKDQSADRERGYSGSSIWIISAYAEGMGL